MRKMKITFRVHAIGRMFERGISAGDMRRALDTGEKVEEYPDDAPYPSRLILGWSGGRPLHIVAAYNAVDDEIIVVTVYEPEADRWEANYKRRKR